MDKVADSPNCFMCTEAKFLFQFSPLTTERKKRPDQWDILFRLNSSIWDVALTLMKTAACCFSWLKSCFYFGEGSGSPQVGTDRQMNIHTLCTNLMHQGDGFCCDAVQERKHNMRINHSNAHRSHARTRARSQAGTYRRFLVSGDPRVQNQPFWHQVNPKIDN